MSFFNLGRPAQDIRRDLPDAIAQFRSKIGEARILDARQVSMIDESGLSMLAFAASQAEDTILEIGPYIGGSTIAICLGREGRLGSFISVEAGGAYPDHPHLPTEDIIRDLNANLDRIGFSNAVTILKGWSHSCTTMCAIRHCLAQSRVGLISVDADGNVDDAIEAYASIMRHDCLVVIDDYLSTGAAEKQSKIKPWVDEQVRIGTLREFGVFGSGTWLGQVTGPLSLDTFSRNRLLFAYHAGHCYSCYVGTEFLPDRLADMEGSRLIVYEDGMELWQAHSLHKAIRNFGRGRYSHWSALPKKNEAGLYSGMLLISASDNSDPRNNGRTYGISLDGGNQIVDLASYGFRALVE